MLEAAIPPHLHKPRTCPARLPPDHEPPFPAYCARFPEDMKEFVMLIVGAQYSSPSLHDKRGISTLQNFMTTGAQSMGDTSGPATWDIASVTDKRGYFNIAVFAYWRSASDYRAWEKASGFGEWWASPDRERDGHGWFKEVLCPSVDRVETVFSSSDGPEGAANMQDGISGNVQEHGYWGSMRDRIAAGQDDELRGEAWRASAGAGAEASNGDAADVPTPAAKSRIRVPGKKNLCIIRSGQDWSATLPAERKLYLESMHPVLIKGMNFLRDEGGQIGCYNMNLWDVVAPTTYEANRERTFGFGYFDDMASLEYWTKSHPTHLKIFGGFHVYTKKLNNVLSLKLFHEVYVLEEGMQDFEYVGCHEETGILKSIGAGVGTK